MPARLLGAILAIPLILSPAAATDPARLKDFGLGALAGECLTAKCQVFRGIMLTESPKAGDPVRFKVQEWLFGEQASGETVDVPYDDHRPKSMSYGTAGAAWEHVKFSTGASATVIMALETNGQVIAGQPVVVTFDDREGELIRSVVAEALLLKKTPNLISAVVDALSPSSSPTMAGYILYYVLQSRDIPQRDLHEALLMRMIGNPAIPAEEWRIILFFLTPAYNASPTPEGRSRIIRRYLDLALSDDDSAAAVGLSGLSGIAINPKSGLRDLLSPSVVPALAIKYRALVAKKKLSRSEPLEAILEVR
jgi:hypothetical protein